MGSRWKRNAVIGTMVVLVGAAAALNWRYTSLDRLDMEAASGTASGLKTSIAASTGTDNGAGSGANDSASTGADDNANTGTDNGAGSGADNNANNSADTGRTLGEATLVDNLNNNNDSENISLAEDSVGLLTDEGAVYTGADYFASARLTRQQARDNAISLLQEAASQEDAGEAVLNEASEGIQVLASYTLKEAQIENLVTAKGYQDCVAFMGSDSVSVVVSNGEGELSREDVARIADIAMTETGFPASGVRVMAAS